MSKIPLQTGKPTKSAKAAGLPIDPVSGLPWYLINWALIFRLDGWREFQSQKSMRELIPVMRWMQGSIK